MQTPNNDRLDLWLDEALRQHANVGPRHGMEGRLLARLRSQQEHVWSVRKWAWFFAGPVVAAAAITLVLCMGKGSPTVDRALAEKPSNAKSDHDIKSRAIPLTAKNERTPSLPNPQGRSGSNRQPDGGRHAATQLTENRQPEVSPRRGQFPSPHPLTEQEQLLAEYVAQFPDQAKLVAQEQAKTEKEMEELYSENISRSSQQER